MICDFVLNVFNKVPSKLNERKRHNLVNID